MSYIKRVERVAIAVNDIDEAQSFFETWFGAEFQPSETIEDMGIRYRPFKLGESKLELLESTQDDSPVARFLNAHGGPGIHHITLEVDDLDDALSELEKRGGRIASRHDYAADTHFEGYHWREAFVHPKDAFGVLIHIAEKRPVVPHPEGD